MGQFLINAKDLPIVYIQYPARAELKDVEEMAKQMRAIYAKSVDNPVVTIADLSAVEDYSAEVKKLIADSGNASMAACPGTKLGEAIVATSQLVRAGIRTHYLFRKRTQIPHEIFATKAEALAWAHARLAEPR